MKSICDYLEEDREKWADRPYITTKVHGSWTSRTFQEVVGDIQGLSRSLLKRGYQDKHIMICSENSQIGRAHV